VSLPACPDAGRCAEADLVASTETKQYQTSVIMGLGDDIKDFEQDATGQGGKDGDNNANNA